MSEPLTHKPFMALNASRNNVTKIRPGVVKRSQPEPDRHYVEGAAALKTEQAPGPESKTEKTRPMPAKAAPSEEKVVAVARVKALQKAGEKRKVALARVGKEMGYSHSTLNKWLIKADSASTEKSDRVVETMPKKKKRASKRGDVSRGGKAAFVRQHPSVGVPELVKLAKKQGMRITAAYAYNIRSMEKRDGPQARAPRTQRAAPPNGQSIGDLLATIKDATAEIERRLSQLSL